MKKTLILLRHSESKKNKIDCRGVVLYCEPKYPIEDSLALELESQLDKEKIKSDDISVSLIANNGPYTYEWRKNSQAISGANQAIYTATQTGTYTVIVTDNNTSCTNESDTIAVIANSTNFNLVFTANQTTFTIPPFIKFVFRIVVD